MSIILHSVRLSNNSSYDKVAYEEGVNGWVNITKSSGKYFVVLDFKDEVTSQIVSRVYFGKPLRNHIWDGFAPKELMSLIGKRDSFKGKFLTREGFTTFLFEHEMDRPDAVSRVFEVHAFLKLDGLNIDDWS